MKRIRLNCSHAITRCFIANYSLGVEDNADEATNTNVFAFPARRFEDFFCFIFQSVAYFSLDCDSMQFWVYFL